MPCRPPLGASAPPPPGFELCTVREHVRMSMCACAHGRCTGRSRIWMLWTGQRAASSSQLAREVHVGAASLLELLCFTCAPPNRPSKATPAQSAVDLLAHLAPHARANHCSAASAELILTLPAWAAPQAIHELCAWTVLPLHNAQCTAYESTRRVSTTAPLRALPALSNLLLDATTPGAG